MTETAHNPPDLVDAFLRRAESASSMAAVDDGGVAVTYGELRSLAFRFAGSIQRASSRGSPRVLLALPPSASAYAAMIGSLIAGGTFCPVDVSGPEDRNATICKTFCPDIILFEGNPPPFLDTLPVTIGRLDVLRPERLIPNAPAVERSEVAYVVFTSGSTGHPKLVKVGRQGFSYFLHVVQKYFDLGPAERWGQFSNLAHDLGVMDVFMALTQGGTLVPLDEGERLRPATAIRDRRVSVWHSVPSVLELMLRAKQLAPEYLMSLRVMSFCGEPLLPHHLDVLFAARPDLVVFNTYGTTETTGFNTFNRLTASNYRDSCEAGSVAIGDDVPGWSIHLRGGGSSDDGEIVVASEFLSLGYWQDEDQTRATFRQVQFGRSPAQRSYFTGDRGVRKGSRLFCSARLDRQVKIRGERIELDEVDHQLREAGFMAAYTIMKDGELHSFVESNADVDQERVRAHLKKSLPFHAIPKSVNLLPSLPRTPNGKIDREALSRQVRS